jgi:hypothetical protein
MKTTFQDTCENDKAITVFTNALSTVVRVSGYILFNAPPITCTKGFLYRIAGHRHKVKYITNLFRVGGTSIHFY